jgi:hypothetical protein
MRDLREISKALDQFKAARGHYPDVQTIQHLEAQLAPTYLRAVPHHDRWKHSLRYEAWKEKTDDAGPQNYSIGSPGANGKFEKAPLRLRVLEASSHSGADIVLTNGRFVSTPEPEAPGRCGGDAAGGRARSSLRAGHGALPERRVRSRHPAL